MWRWGWWQQGENGLAFGARSYPHREYTIKSSYVKAKLSGHCRFRWHRVPDRSSSDVWTFMGFGAEVRIRNENDPASSERLKSACSEDDKSKRVSSGGKLGVVASIP